MNVLLGGDLILEVQDRRSEMLLLSLRFRLILRLSTGLKMELILSIDFYKENLTRDLEPKESTSFMNIFGSRILNGKS
jgi:hypothetical protein